MEETFPQCHEQDEDYGNGTITCCIIVGPINLIRQAGDIFSTHN